MVTVAPLHGLRQATQQLSREPGVSESSLQLALAPAGTGEDHTLASWD